MPGSRKAALAGIAALVMVLAGGCGRPTAGSSPRATGPASATGAITVLAAASLTEAFTEIGHGFEATHPGEQVRFSFGSSSTLATQITQGAPADVFAAASPATMKKVTDAGAAGQPVNFVSNTLEIAVPKGNPGRITGLKDFTDPSKTIAICAPEVPCGAAAAQVFAAAKLIAKPDTLEQDVKAALQKVSSDEVDAALVYRTDVVAAEGAVEGITFAESTLAVNDYPIATLTGAHDPATAQAFVNYVLSAPSEAILTKAGFAQP